MSFPSEFLDEIRNRVALADLISRRVKLKKRGREHEGLCPFHNEKTPSFTVSEAKGFFHCFGCGAHGDAIGWVMKVEGLSFPEAVEKLAAETGLAMPERTPEQQEAAHRRAGLLEVLEAAAQWFQSELAGSGGAEARAYLERRGVRPETSAAFRLGFAPDRRGALRLALNAKGVDDSQLVEAGLIKAVEDGGAPRDYFFNRLIFPITDRRGRVIAFGGRALGESKAKYLNSPETSVFHKGRVLYNLARARQAAHDTGEVVVTEGYMDVIALAQAGFPAAVAPLGTAVTAEQVAELWRLAPEPLLCLDGDAAGRRAAGRAAETALPGLAPGRSLRFALLPAGEDPDSLIAGAGAAALRRVLDSALDLQDLLWFQACEGRDLSTPERRAGLWRALSETLVTIGDKEVQAAYRQAMIERFEQQLGYNPVTGWRRRASGPSARSGAARQRPGSSPAGAGLRQPPEVLRRRHEEVLVAAAVNHPQLLLEGAEALAAVDFAAEDLSLLVTAILDQMAAAPDLDSDSLKCHLSQHGFSDLLKSLLSKRVYIHGGFARPDTPFSEVRPKWTKVLADHRRWAARNETLAATRRFAERPDEETLAWLQARQRSAEGGENDKTAMDFLASGDAAES